MRIHVEQSLNQLHVTRRAASRYASGHEDARGRAEVQLALH
jgi:hypothetical protein